MKKNIVYTAEKTYSRQIEWLKGVDYDSEFFKIIDGTAYVIKGYKWDGASPKIFAFGRIIGTPDFHGKTFWATMWHDCFYEHSDKLNIPRYLVDALFIYDLLVVNFVFSFLYYRMVRFFGFFTYKKTKYIENVTYAG